MLSAPPAILFQVELFLDRLLIFSAPVVDTFTAGTL